MTCDLTQHFTSDSKILMPTKRRKAQRDGGIVKDVATTQLPPYLPDLAIHNILRLLPTKSAVRMSFLSKQWDGVRPSTLVLDFDEGNIDLDDDQQQRKFIHIWEQCVAQYQKNKKQPLDKFRLRMRYFARDSFRVRNWLSFALDKDVKELSISLPTSPNEEKYSLRDIWSTSLKSLEIEHCNCRKFFEVNALNLESLTFVSNSKTEGVEVRSNHLKHLVLCGFRNNVRVKIMTSNLRVGFSGYNLKPNSNLWDANITLPRLSDFDGSLEHYSSLRDYLAIFDCCKVVFIGIINDTDIIFPEDFRKILSPPLPNIEHIEVNVRSRRGTEKLAEIKDCLFWMAPAAAETAKVTQCSIRIKVMA